LRIHQNGVYQAWIALLRGHANAHFSAFSFAQISRAALGGSHPD
jgi:hypothetical protein